MRFKLVFWSEVFLFSGIFVTAEYSSLKIPARQKFSACFFLVFFIQKYVQEK